MAIQDPVFKFNCTSMFLVAFTPVKLGPVLLKHCYLENIVVWELQGESVMPGDAFEGRVIFLCVSTFKIIGHSVGEFDDSSPFSPKFHNFSCLSLLHPYSICGHHRNSLNYCHSKTFFKKWLNIWSWFPCKIMLISGSHM